MTRPVESRDQKDQAEAYFHNPARSANQILIEENLRLKRLLRENGISWSPLSEQAGELQPKAKKRRTRAARGKSVVVEEQLPYLPTEVQMRILSFAMTSAEPIIDPLFKLRPENLTPEERKRGNQIAIHALATCKTWLTEGRRYLWSNNTFVFTHPTVLVHFQELDAQYRKNIKHITLRILARFYDETKRLHMLSRFYHPLVHKEVVLRLDIRPKDHFMGRGGFRSYTWLQLVDFLAALRPPFDPEHVEGIRPLLLPNMNSMHIDFINFPSETLRDLDGSLHGVSTHDLAFTLDRMHVTGLPFDDAGARVSVELTGMLRDGGLYVKGIPTYLANKTALKVLAPWPEDHRWPPCFRVVRGSRQIKARQAENRKAAEALAEQTARAAAAIAAGAAAPGLGNKQAGGKRGRKPNPDRVLPRLTYASEEGQHHDAATLSPDAIWKQVPWSGGERKGETRWVEFSARTGLPLESMEQDDDVDPPYCANCGLQHPPAAFEHF